MTRRSPLRAQAVRGSAKIIALATAIVATGVFAPVVALLYGVSGSASSGLALILPTFACFGAGALLHSLGWLTLGRLRE